jgi:hypothetical protein
MSDLATGASPLCFCDSVPLCWVIPSTRGHCASASSDQVRDTPNEPAQSGGERLGGRVMSEDTGAGLAVARR